MLFKKREKEEKQFDIYENQPRDSIVGEMKYQLRQSMRQIPVLCESVIVHYKHEHFDFSIIRYARLLEELQMIRKWKKAYDREQLNVNNRKAPKRKTNSLRKRRNR